MARHLFIGQHTLGTWLEQDKVEFEDNIMTIKADGRRFKLVEAVRFIKVEGEEQDTAGLLGRVKTDQQLEQMGAERYRDSVIYEEVAYKVQEGFIGEVCLPGREPVATTVSGQIQPPSQRAEVEEHGGERVQAVPAPGSGSRQVPRSAGAGRDGEGPAEQGGDDEPTDEELLVRFLLDNTLK